MTTYLCGCKIGLWSLFPIFGIGRGPVMASITFGIIFLLNASTGSQNKRTDIILKNCRRCKPKISLQILLKQILILSASRKRSYPLKEQSYFQSIFPNSWNFEPKTPGFCTKKGRCTSVATMESNTKLCGLLHPLGTHWLGRRRGVASPPQVKPGQKVRTASKAKAA